MIALIVRLWHYLSRADLRQRESYFSEAADRVDLERRMREWERGHLGLRSFY